MNDSAYLDSHIKPATVKRGPRFVDITGQKFSRWTVIDVCDVRGGKHYWNCVCSCGTKRAVNGGSLRLGLSHSCGCWNLEVCVISGKNNRVHGQSHRTPEYNSWCSMRQRCRDKNSIGYAAYGGRGITIDPAWDDFSTFASDMGKRPSLAYSLNRKNNNLGYSKSNCEWSTDLIQSNNKRNNHFLELDGQRHTISQWSRITGFGDTTIHQRLARGWTIRDALTKPRVYIFPPRLKNG